MVTRRLFRRVAVAALLASLAAMSTTSHAQQQAAEFVPGEVIVQFKTEVTEDQRRGVRNAHGASVRRSYATLRTERLSIPDNANPIALARAFSAHPEVEAAQPNYIRHTTSVGSPNDPHYVNGLMYGLPKISAPLAWSSFGAGTQTVIVADIDTGVNYTHPDLAANMWVNPGEIAGNHIDDDNNGYVDDVYGIDAGNNDSDPMDDHGHGTHTSGTFGAVSDNGVGVAGVAKNVKILACKFIRANGFGSDGDAIECFNYVVAMKQRGNNIRVTSNSWGSDRGGGADAGALKNAIDAAGAAGIINIFAAGNANTNTDLAPFDPASFTSPSIVSVAASDQNDFRAGFSNYGATSVDLAAPGVDTLSTYGGGYAYLSGTSMATPHVAGAAAFLLSHRPALTVAETKTALLNSVDLLGSWNGLVATGGRLNMFQAVNIAPGGGGLTNLAAASSGATASASTTLSAGFAPSGAINGDRTAGTWGSGGGWADATLDVFPDWLQVDFAGSKTISEVDVFTIQDAYQTPTAPTPSMTFTQYGARDFVVQYWTGSAWLPIPGASVTNNNLVWRQFTFAPITTSRIRVVVSAAASHWSILTEVEAWGTAPAVGNTPPTASLTAPADGATYVAPAAITLTASANDPGGAVSSINYYANGTWIGSATVSPYTLNWTNVPVGSYTLMAVALDNQGATTPSSTMGVSVTGPGGGLTNVAAASSGATASASTTLSAGFAPSGAINGDRTAGTWGSGGGWADATLDVFPDWLQVAFAASKTISEVDVFTIQDAYQTPTAPTPAMTFTQYGARDFVVQYWNGSTWLAIPGASVTNNNLVWRQFTFAPITTTGIRVVVSAAASRWSIITEVEAWGTAAAGGNAPPTVTLTAPADGATYVAPAAITLSASANDPGGAVSSVSYYANSTWIGSATVSPYTVNWTNVPAGNYTLLAVALDNQGATTPSSTVGVSVTGPGGGPPVNVAAASTGATASASSLAGAGYDASGAINGDRTGANWAAGGGWADGTPSVFPDWLQVNFAGSKTISEIDVFTVQDNYASPSPPTPAMTFSQYGAQDFEVQYWNGSTWLPIPGAVVTNNNLVWRHFAFAPLTTSRIRVVVSRGAWSYSFLTEVEAWGN
jgi:subtilisin family serine protease